MFDWQFYFISQAQSFVITITSTMICNWAILRCLFVTHRIRVKTGRMFLGNLLISVCCILPQFAAHFLFYHDGSVIAIIYNLLLFTSPLFVFLYYWLFRRVLRLSKGVTLASIEFFILSQFINLLTFSFFTNIWTALMSADYFAIIFPPDLLAMLCTDLLFVLMMVGHSRVTRRRGRYVDLPAGYSDERLERTLPVTFLSVLSVFATVVTVCTLLMQQFRVDISFYHAWLYFLLILIIAFRISDNYRRQRLDLLQWQKTETQGYINSLLHAQNEFRGIKHDMKNMLQIYDGYIAMDNMEALRGYHGSVMTTFRRTTVAMELLAALRNRTALYTLLDIKIQRADDFNITMGVNNVGQLAGVRMNDLDLCRILGNLLDNAIDAASLSDQKTIDIDCRRPDGRHVQVEISNTTAGNVDVARIFERGYTSKGEGHDGQGLAAVRDMLALYEGCSIRVEYDDLRFTAVVTFVTDPVGVS